MRRSAGWWVCQKLKIRVRLSTSLLCLQNMKCRVYATDARCFSSEPRPFISSASLIYFERSLLFLIEISDKSHIILVFSLCVDRFFPCHIHRCAFEMTQTDLFICSVTLSNWLVSSSKLYVRVRRLSCSPSQYY